MSDFLDLIRDDHHDFDKGTLSYSSHLNPFDLFHQWYKDTFDNKQAEANALVLGTVSEKGIPSSRVLYLKELSDEGFVFYTNYDSQKGKEIAVNPVSSMLFFWNSLERQVRVQGSIKKIREEQSDTYFASRPRESQIGAWASFQSQKLASRNELQERFDKLNIQYAGQDIPRPPHWGGYVLVPNLIEFWQGRSSRLHDRIVFVRSSTEDLVWDCYRKNP